MAKKNEEFEELSDKTLELMLFREIITNKEFVGKFSEIADLRWFKTPHIRFMSQIAINFYRKYGGLVTKDLVESAIMKKNEKEIIDSNKIDLNSAIFDFNKAKDLDLGFRAFRVDESNFRDVSVTPSEMVQGNLLESVDNIREDATALDLLFQVMLAWGSRLSLKISEQKLEDNTIYSVDEGSLIACFDDRITEETIRALAQQKPQRAVFKDTSFTHSADKINLTQIFKEVSPETQVKVV